jgi:hypothetical protein
MLSPTDQFVTTWGTVVEYLIFVVGVTFVLGVGLGVYLSKKGHCDTCGKPIEREAHFVLVGGCKRCEPCAVRTGVDWRSSNPALSGRED